MADQPQLHLVVSWDEFLRDCRILAKHVHDLYGDIYGVIAVARGGLIPAAVIARELDIRIVDTICVQSYAGTLPSSAVKILSTIDSVRYLHNRWLIVDDLVDSGRTAKLIKRHLSTGVYATVYAKPEGEPFTDHFVQRVEQDTWIHFPWETGQQPSKPFKGEG